MAKWASLFLSPPKSENLGMKKTPIYDIYHWSCLLNFVGASTSFTGKVNS
jgi:hypothetical protein